MARKNTETGKFDWPETSTSLAAPKPEPVKELMKPRKIRFFWQGDKRYRADLVGHGTSTMWKAGCLVTALHIAALYYGTVDADSLPGDTNQLLKGTFGVFDGSNLYLHKAAPLVGLRADLKDRLVLPYGDPRLSALLEKTLKAGDLAIIHVSTDGDPKNGGEHFILAYGMTDTDILCADPALATSVALPRATLAKVMAWGTKKKPYQVVSVRPLRIAPQAD